MTERAVLEDDFAIFRVLGRGGFGLVNACKRCTTGKLYAMKMLNKKRIKMKKAEALCLQERNIMALISSSYVVCLKYAFSTKDDLYLILDLMVGGDLGFHLSKRGRFTIKESRYYAARTLLGIAALHEKNIAYRDLKPENILMDEDGYTKISDLGLACKVGKSGLSGTCGTLYILSSICLSTYPLKTLYQYTLIIILSITNPINKSITLLHYVCIRYAWILGP